MLLMFYCGLVSPVVSVHSSSDMLHRHSIITSSVINGTLLVSNSTINSSASTPSSANNDGCFLQLKESEISELIELTKNDRINLVDLHFFSDGSNKETSFVNTRLVLANLIGREILYTLDINRYTFLTYTLNAGRTSFSLHVNGSLEKCRKPVQNFLAVSTLQQTGLAKNPARNYEICYKGYAWTLPEHLFCCRVTCNHIYSFIHKTGFPSILTIAMSFTALVSIIKLLHVLLSERVFDRKYSKYHKLHYSLMSPSSILLNFFWKKSKKYAYVIFCVRTFILAASIICIVYITWKPILTEMSNTGIDILPLMSNLAWLLAFPLVMAFTTTEFLNRHRIGFEHFISDISLSLRSIGFEPFKASTFLPFYICFLFLFPFFLLREIHYLFVNLFVYNFEENCFSELLKGLLNFCLFSTLYFQTLYVLVFMIQSLLLGLFLNVIHFTPYLASFSVLTFYCYSSWKSLEEKYLLLKRIVYKACRDKPDDPDERDDSEISLKENEILLPVVSKELYENVRKKFMPYDVNLFLVSVELMWSIIFSYGIFELVNLLQEFNVTPAVGVVTTASLAIIPRLFSIAHLQKENKELNKAWKKELKLKVKHMVKEAIEKNPDLAQTVLIVKYTLEDENENSGENSGGSEAANNSDPTQLNTDLAQTVLIIHNLEDENENSGANSGGSEAANNSDPTQLNTDLAQTVLIIHNLEDENENFGGSEAANNSDPTQLNTDLAQTVLIIHNLEDENENFGGSEASNNSDPTQLDSARLNSDHIQLVTSV